MKRPMVFLFIGTLLLYMGIFFSQFPVEKEKELSGQAAMQKITFSAKDPADGKSLFTEEDIKGLIKSFHPLLAAWSVQENTMAVCDQNTEKVRINAANGNYAMFRALDIIRGSFFSDINDAEKGRVAVIDDTLAWKLFRNDNVIGCSIGLYGKEFKVIGVSKHESSVLRTLTRDGSENVYIPIKTWAELNDGKGIPYVQFETQTGSTLGKNSEDAENALLSIGKDPGRYQLIDYNIRKKQMEQKFDLALFIMGLYVIIVMVLCLKRKGSLVIQTLRQECKTDYFTHAVRLHHKSILEAVFFFLLVAGGSLIVWELIHFRVYIPTRLIPDNLTRISYFVNLVKDGIMQRVSDMGYVAPLPEFEANVLQWIHNLVFYVGCIAGMSLFLAGLAGLRKKGVPWFDGIAFAGEFILAAMAFSVFMGWLIGFPVFIQMKGLIIFCIFISTCMARKGFYSANHLMEREEKWV